MNNRPAYYSVLCACFLAVSPMCASSAQSQNAGFQPPSATLKKGFGLYDGQNYAETTVALKSVLDGETKDSLPNKQRADYFMAKALYQLKLYAVSLDYLDGMAFAGSTNLYYGISLKWLVALSRVLPETSGVHETLATYDRSHFDEPANADVRDEVFYLRGRHLQRKGETDSAIALLEKISQASPMRLKGNFILGVAHVAGGEAKLALSAFQEVLRFRPDKSSSKSVEESVRVKTLATLQLARIHYANKDFKTSIHFYRKIPKNSSKHQEAQFELPWAYTLSGHFTNALATLYALGASGANAQVMSESSLLRSVIFHKLCQHDRALANLEAHEERYGGLASQLAAFIDTYEDNAEFAMHLNHVGKKAGSSRSLVENVVLSILQEGRSNKLLEWVKQLRSELEIVERAAPAWQTSSIELRDVTMAHCATMICCENNTCESDIAGYRSTELQDEVSIALFGRLELQSEVTDLGIQQTMPESESRLCAENVSCVAFLQDRDIPSEQNRVMENTLSTYSGGCHCGKVKYSVDVAADTELINCNCSICRRAGWLLVFVGESAFRLEGKPQLTDYLFHKEEIHHTFCPTCGVRSFSKGAMPDGSVLYAVNMRCTDADLSTFEVKEYDGASV